jgi:hypothetical protein
MTPELKEDPPESTTISIKPSGVFDLSLGFVLWQYGQPDRRPYLNYWFDLSGVTETRDSGLGWLRMFVRWAQERGTSAHLFNARPDIGERFTAAGLVVEDWTGGTGE